MCLQSLRPSTAPIKALSIWGASCSHQTGGLTNTEGTTGGAVTGSSLLPLHLESGRLKLERLAIGGRRTQALKADWVHPPLQQISLSPFALSNFTRPSPIARSLDFYFTTILLTSYPAALTVSWIGSIERSCGSSSRRDQAVAKAWCTRIPAGADCIHPLTAENCWPSSSKNWA